MALDENIVIDHYCILRNARSAKNKLSELHHFLYTSNIDCVFITESWLDNSISDHMLDPNDKFAVLGKDRIDSSRSGVRAVVKKIVDVKCVNIERLNVDVELLGHDS